MNLLVFCDTMQMRMVTEIPVSPIIILKEHLLHQIIFLFISLSKFSIWIICFVIFYHLRWTIQYGL